MCTSSHTRFGVCGHKVTYYTSRCTKPDCGDHTTWTTLHTSPNNCDYCRRYDTISLPSTSKALTDLEIKIELLDKKMRYKLNFLPNGELMTGEKLKGLEKVAGVGLRAPVVLEFLKLQDEIRGCTKGLRKEVERLDGELEGDKPKVGERTGRHIRRTGRKFLTNGRMR